MNPKQIEEHETKRYLQYKKQLTDIVEEFKAYVNQLEKKYLTNDEIETKMNVLSDDARFIVSFDLEKLMGKK